MSFSAPIEKPAYRRQKGHDRPDRAFVVLDGVRHYLGAYDSPESREAYDRLLAERAATGRTATPSPGEITITDLCAYFWEHAQRYYRHPDGTATGEQESLKLVLHRLRALYASLPVEQFSPRCFKAIAQRMVEDGLARTYINLTLARLRAVFKWAVAEELAPVEVWHRLQAVSGLKRGRCAAREPEPVKPVLRAHVEAVFPHVSRQIVAMIELQWLTGMRSGEVTIMRPCDVDKTQAVWTYKPQKHKTAHHGHDRTVYLGPQAQAVLQPFLEGKSPWNYCFSPQEAEQERRQSMHAERVTPLSCGNRPGTNRVEDPQRAPLECYCTRSYARAITRACELAKVPHWHPHQLRHYVGFRTMSCTSVDSELLRSSA